MTEPSDAAKTKADEIMGRTCFRQDHVERLATFIQQVSDAAKAASANAAKYPAVAEEILAPFILPEPVDPIDAKIREAGYLPAIRTNLAAVGLKIVKDET